MINLDLVRRVDADGFTLVSLPGYFDRRFIAESSGCNYKPEDAQALGRLARGSKNPVVLISHGPPRQSGKLALDVTTDGKNVGTIHELDHRASPRARSTSASSDTSSRSGNARADLEGKPIKAEAPPRPQLYHQPGPGLRRSVGPQRRQASARAWPRS